ncbi:MAG: serine/threonine protein kinase [Planctomycetes bacterium]|nr:serine/threonine protein kinase [Planctomycetota bacterium]
MRDASKVDPFKATVPVAKRVQEIWSTTLHPGADPVMTVRQLPEASAQDLDELQRTVVSEPDSPALAKTITNVRVPPSAQATRVDGTTHLDRTVVVHTTGGASPAAPNAPTMPMPRAAEEGLAGRDFFAFKEVLGKGGMGIVHTALQGSLKREVAVKTMKSGGGSPSETAAFIREALTTGSLSHPNIVPVHLFGRDDVGRLFLVMKRVEGRPWSAMLKEEKASQNGVDLARHLEIFQKACDAVAFAHAQGVIHRDLKPENVMVGNFGEVMVMDWGLALDVSSEGRIGRGLRRQQASTVAGSPAYMAPEMALAEIDKFGPATDIYLMGSTLHEIVTGLPPHRGRTVFEVLAHSASGALDPIQPQKGLPREIRELEIILRKALAKEPHERYATVAALQADLRSFQVGQGDRESSLKLGGEARKELDEMVAEVRENRISAPLYPRCAEVLAKAQQSLTLWGNNHRAARVRQEALALYADLARQSRDWGLAESLLRDLRLTGSGAAALAQPIENRLRQQREAWERRQAFFQYAYRFAAIMSIVLVFVALYVFFQLSETKLERENLSTQNEDLFKQIEELQNVNADLAKRGAPPAPVHVPVPPDWAANNRPDPGQRMLRDPGGARGPRFQAKALFEPLQVPSAAGGFAKILGVAEGPGGALLLWDDEGRLWSASGAGGRLAAERIDAGKLDGIAAAAWIDERKVAVADSDGGVRVGDVERADRPWMILRRGGDPAKRLAVGGPPEGRRIALGGAQGVALLGLDGKVLQSVPMNGEVLALHFQDDGVLCAAAGSHLVFLGMGEGMVQQPRILRSEAVRADGAGATVALVMGDRLREMMIVNLGGNQGRNFSFQDGDISALAVSSDGRTVAAGSTEGELVVLAGWPPTVERAGRCPGIEKVSGVGLSADGKRVLVLDASGALHVLGWNGGGR